MFFCRIISDEMDKTYRHSMPGQLTKDPNGIRGNEHRIRIVQKGVLICTRICTEALECVDILCFAGRACECECR